MSLSSIKVNRITIESADDIVAFIRNEFLKYEPMCEYLGDFTSEANDQAVRLMIKYGLGVEAIDTENDNERVGVYLCQIYKKGSPNDIDLELAKLPVEEKMDKIGKFLDYTKTFVNEEIYGKQKKDVFFEGMIVSVKQGYNGRGIGQLLTYAIMDMAKELKIDLVYVGCSSEFTARLVAKMGFTQICNIPYADYKVDGEQVLNPRYPHTAFKGYMMLLE